MKTWVFLFVLLSHSAQAQTANERWLDQCCQCFGSVSLAGLSSAAIEIQADSCARLAMLTHYTAVLKENEIDIDNDSLLLKLGERLGQLLYERCTPYRDYFYKLGRAQLEERVDKLPITTGYLVGLRREPDGRQFFLIQNDSGNIERFLWWREFDGSARFFDGAGDFLYQKVELAWDNIELYDANTKKYALFKEVHWLNTLYDVPNLQVSKKREKELERLRTVSKKEIKKMLKDGRG